MNLEDHSLQELCQGYVHDPGTATYHCLHCGESFQEGEVYPLAGRFFLAGQAIRQHLQAKHPDALQRLIHSDSKYNSLTAHQKQLCELFAAGYSDKEIAKELGVAASTVRHQKFSFREKAKQAKLYLAIYEQVFAREQKESAKIMPIHEHATMVDERFVITEEERQHILETAFASLEPLRLKALSPKEKKKVVILGQIAGQFQPGREYSEKELNQILAEIHEDFATLRRYLIEYGFMKRARDCSKYWLT